MKRLLVVLALAGALLLALAAPALAEAPWAQTPFRLDLKTAYIFVYGDGTWFELTGDREAPDSIWHDPGDPIPANYDVVMQFSWKNVTYGLVKTLPNAFNMKFSIPEAGIDMSYEDAKQYWMGVSLWDDYMIRLTWPIDPFNPHIGAKVYAIRWFPMLTGESGIATNLVDGRLPEGTYTVHYSEKLLHTYINLDLLTDEYGNPLNHAPYRGTPEGEYVTDYSFVIGPPEE